MREQVVTAAVWFAATSVPLSVIWRRARNAKKHLHPEG